MENFPQNNTASVATPNLETSSKHLGANAEHDEVGVVPDTEEDPPELLKTPEDLAEHVPAHYRKWQKAIV